MTRKEKLENKLYILEFEILFKNTEMMSLGYNELDLKKMDILKNMKKDIIRELDDLKQECSREQEIAKIEIKAFERYRKAEVELEYKIKNMSIIEFIKYRRKLIC